jgi:hypothetical protein
LKSSFKTEALSIVSRRPGLEVELVDIVLREQGWIPQDDHFFSE